MSRALFGRVTCRTGSGRKVLAAFGAAGIQHATAAFGGHASAKTVAARTNEVRRLKSALHGRFSGSGLAGGVRQGQDNMSQPCA